jgi:sulfur carrier protein
MKLTVNGQVREMDSGATLSAFLASLQLTEKLVLAELNGQAVDRSNFAVIKLAEGDVLEIVRMVGGG